MFTSGIRSRRRRYIIFNGPRDPRGNGRAEGVAIFRKTKKPVDEKPIDPETGDRVSRGSGREIV